MDIQNYTKQQGEFLKAEVVNNNPSALFEITGEAEIVHNEKFNKDDLHVPLKMGDREFIFNCSKTNSRVISDVCGNETKNWVGRHLILETYKTKTSDGKLVDAINVKEIK